MAGAVSASVRRDGTRRHGRVSSARLCRRRPGRPGVGGACLPLDTNDAEGTMLALCELIGKTVVYQRRSEKGVQSSGTHAGSEIGVVPQHGCLHAKRLHANSESQPRFSSGCSTAASRAGRGTTHAWTEVYLPTLGWRGFDPTVGGSIPHHIVVGVSSHPRGVMPVSGAFLGPRWTARRCTWP